MLKDIAVISVCLAQLVERGQLAREDPKGETLENFVSEAIILFKANLYRMPGSPGLDGRDGVPGEPGLDGVPGK